MQACPLAKPSPAPGWLRLHHRTPSTSTLEVELLAVKVQMCPPPSLCLVPGPWYCRQEAEQKQAIQGTAAQYLEQFYEVRL